MTAYEEAMHLVRQLTIRDKVRLLQAVSDSLQQDLETEAYKHIPWEQFLERTYGSLADDPLARDQPPLPDERESID